MRGFRPVGAIDSGSAFCSADPAFTAPSAPPIPGPGGRVRRWPRRSGDREPLLPARAMQWSSCVPAVRTPGGATAGDLPGSPGHSSPPRRTGVVLAPARSSAPCGRPLPQAPLCSSDPWRRRMVAFSGADFLPLRGASLPWRRCDQTRAPRDPCPLSARFAPSYPASLPPRPGRRAGSTGLGRGGPPPPVGVISIPGLQCRQHRAGPAERRSSQPAWLRARAGRAVVPAGGWCRAG